MGWSLAEGISHLGIDLWQLAEGEPELAEPEDRLQIMLLTCLQAPAPSPVLLMDQRHTPQNQAEREYSNNIPAPSS